MLTVAAAGAMVILAAACESKEERQARVQAEARTRVAAESARASTAAPASSAGIWNDAQLAKRFVDAGLAPQRRDSVHSQPWMGVPVHSFTLGVATVDAYIYRDSLARRAAVAKLDPITYAPRGQTSPWGVPGVPHEVVENNNLVAIVVGGTDRQRERIVTALAAGIGAP